MAVVVDEQSRPLLHTLQPLWHHAAPRSVIKRASLDDPLRNWSAWQKHLARRKQPTNPRFLQGKQPPLLWGWSTAWRREQIRQRIKSAPGREVIGLQFALEDSSLDDAARGTDLSVALQVIALAYSLPELAADVTAETWWRIVDRLHDFAVDAQQHRVDWPADPHDVVRQQLLAGELALALSYLLPEIRPLRELQKPARAVISEALIELTDGRGLPHARLLPVLGPLFACWTRAGILGEQMKQGAWTRKADIQYEWLVRHALRLADRGGCFLLTIGDDTTPAWSNDMLAAALELAGDQRDWAAAAIAISPRLKPKRGKLRESAPPNASVNSDWSGVAVMATGWSQKDERLAIAYSDDRVIIELSARDERILAGEWTSETTCDGEAVKVEGEWERLCWESGKRYDFLELGADLTNGLRLERQILFGRDDLVLYLTDIVSAPNDESRLLKHTLRLPVESSSIWQPQAETRDGLLVGRHTRAAVLPLALAEWRSDPRGGELTFDGGQLTLTQEAQGRALCCPIFIDLNKKRSKLDRTWRQLTVAEWMEVLPHDLAVAFRAQSGPNQWIFYRSLGPPGNRTFMGQNIAGEFSAGRFYNNGKYKEWIEIEAV